MYILFHKYCMHRFYILRANTWKNMFAYRLQTTSHGYNIVPVSILTRVCGMCPLSFQNSYLQGRLKPGRMLLVDTHEKVLSKDEELKLQIARSRPHSLWIQEQVRHLCSCLLECKNIYNTLKPKFCSLPLVITAYIFTALSKVFIILCGCIVHRNT